MSGTNDILIELMCLILSPIFQFISMLTFFSQIIIAVHFDATNFHLYSYFLGCLFKKVIYKGYFRQLCYHLGSFQMFWSLKQRGKDGRHSMLDFQLFWIFNYTDYYSSMKDKYWHYMLANTVFHNIKIHWYKLVRGGINIEHSMSSFHWEIVY